VDELTTRPWRPQDSGAVAALNNAIDLALGGSGGATAESIADFATLMADADTDSRLLWAPDGTLVAAAMVAAPPAGGFRVDVPGGVHPDWLGRGIGRDLLAWQVRRAEEIHRRREPGRPWEIHFWTMAANKAAVGLFERTGLRAERYWFEMVAPTTPPPVPVPDGLRVAGYDPTHRERVHEAHMEAFADHWGYQRRSLEEWAPLTIDATAFLPEYSRLAFDGHDLAGYVLCYRTGNADQLLVGHVGTRRPWRGRGLAAALLADVLGAAGAAGIPTAVLGVDAASPTGAVGVYERIGFEVESRGTTYVHDLPA
jgi:mycothiol synthase